ncbi:MAG: PEP-CTERM sorting domain-containing protein [Nitrosomonadales bacterium]|nr:PEP-CTERM sorting domain-containing protein [Nitrosomonadales bacterium]
MTLAGSAFSFNQVYDYHNNYGGTVSGYGPNSPGEGIAAESRAFGAFNPSGPWTLTLSFDQAVLGVGLFVTDLFNGLGNRTVTLAAYDGINGTGNQLALAGAPQYNFQLYNKLFLGVAQDGGAPTIRSMVFTNPIAYYGDGIVLDDIRFANAAPVPEPETYALLLAGLGMLGLTVRRRKG